MRPRTGLDEDVSTYVLKWNETSKFIEKVTDLLSFMLPQYKREGKSQLVIAIGCTGGQHRSVAWRSISVIILKWIMRPSFPTGTSRRERA